MDYGGFHAMDTSDPEHPKIVHGFLPRTPPGYQIIDTWDTLGMRATQSQDTVLDRAFVPDELCPVVCPAGFAGAGPFQVAHLRLGAARLRGDVPRGRPAGLRPDRRAHAPAHVDRAHPLDGPPPRGAARRRRHAHRLDAADALLERTCADWATGVDHADWPVRLVATRSFVIGKAFEIVDTALDLTGGAGVFKRSRLEQLFRDVRMGRFHPGNTLLAHELIGKLCLGIDPDEPPRWG